MVPRGRTPFNPDSDRAKGRWVGGVGKTRALSLLSRSSEWGGAGMCPCWLRSGLLITY